MKRMLFNATYQEELRVALVEGQKLINFDIETASKAQKRGNIYKGIITRVEPSLEACFVDYGTDKQGFLPFKEIDPKYVTNYSNYKDFNRLTTGIELIVQIDKDERGNKGAALTTLISLPGRYLVLMPNSNKTSGISRRIEGDEREELKAILSKLEIPSHMSIIARTAALRRDPKELQWDLNYLLKLWDAIKNVTSKDAKGFLIYQESNLVIRSIRDHFSPEITEVLIDVEEVYVQACQFIANVMPAYVDRVKLYTDNVPLFSRFQIEYQIETAYSRLINLPSGGSIAIDRTEALTAIDVNSARANKGVDIEATAFTTNLEATEEIARQMRLRDLGGLVVVDFIDMENPKNQREVENFFKEQLSLDRARIQMGKLSKFGLLELSRQRLQASLEEHTTISCPRCDGIGVIRGIESLSVHILRIIQEEAVKNSNYLSAIHIQLPVTIATYLLNEKREDVAKIEQRMRLKIVLIPNVHIESPQYKIKKVAKDDIDLNKISYDLVENLEEATYKANDKKIDQAVVRNIAPSQPAPIIARTFIGKIWQAIKNKFAAVDEIKEIVPAPSKEISKDTNNKSKSTRKVQNTKNPKKVTKTSKELKDNALIATSTKEDINQSAKKIKSVVQKTENLKEEIPNKVISQAKIEPKKSRIDIEVAIEPKEILVESLIEETNSLALVSKRNTIVDKVDLGNLAMVVTSQELAIQDIFENSKVIRYNDIVRDKNDNKFAKIEYQLVQTRTN